MWLSVPYFAHLRKKSKSSAGLSKLVFQADVLAINSLRISAVLGENGVLPGFL